MIVKISKLLLCGIACFALVACASRPKEITDDEDSDYVTAQLSDSDFEKAAKQMLTDVLDNELAEGKKGGGRYLLKVDNIKNDTQQLINTADLTDYIRKELRRSKKVMLTNLGENSAIASSRNLADSELINQSTVQKKGTVYAPELSMFGRISQRDLAIDSSYKKIEYVFSLGITDLKSGAEFWSDKRVIKKIVDKDTLTW